MANLSAFLNSVLSIAGMDDTASSSDETLVTQWLNEGVREVLVRTHCYVTCVDITLTANAWKFTLPASLAIKTIVNEDSEILERVGLDELLELRRADSSTSESRMRYAIEGSNLLLVWPTPTENTTLEAFYVPTPTEMTSGLHDPAEATYGGVPIEFHHAIELWALHRASDHEHEGRTQQGVNYLVQFDEYLKRVVRPAVSRKGGRLPRARTFRPGATPRLNNGRYP